MRCYSFQVERRKHNLHLDKTLRGLCATGRLREAVGLLWRTGLTVESETYSLLLQECIHRKEYKVGKRIHAHVVCVGYEPCEYLKAKLLILHAKSGNMKTARILFDSLPERSLIPWNAMIAGYVQNGLGGFGLDMYYKMRREGLLPDQYTFSSVFRACATLASLELGKRAHAVMIKSHIKGNIVVDSALLDMYLKCSSLSDGRKVFDKLSSRNVITWTSLIMGYGQHGKVEEVLESFCKMKSEGFRPNDVTFLAVLSACSHGGLVNEGWEHFMSMSRDYGIQPRGKHYTAMVDMLGRSGRLKDAYELVMRSSCREHSVIWGALLGACKVHRDMELLEVAARKYFELEQENAGKYVVLCNAYAAFGFWDNVAEVRGVMRDLGVVKDPGYSMIEINGEVHYFLKGDPSHRQCDVIYEMIKVVTCNLKDASYVTDISWSS